MGSGHSHTPEAHAPIEASRGSRWTVALVTVALLVATVVGLVLLWPKGSDVERTELLAPGVEVLDATVESAPDAPDAEGLTTFTAVGRSGPISGESVEVGVTPDVVDGLRDGDRIRIIAVGSGAALPGDEALEEPPDALDDQAGDGQADGAPAGDDVIYSYFDHERTIPLALLLLAYLVVVALVARGAGLRAVIGLSVGVGIVAWFMLPAILAGENAVLVALVAAGAMIFPSVYIAHGISIRTTTAVIGTFGGVVATVLTALLTARPAGMTGADEETARMLFGSYPELSLTSVFLAGVILSGLGALNDVTITQASAVWELRAANPEGSRWEVFRSAMRIGRDHIASTVYTLAYAYIGSALPILLLASTIDRSLVATLSSGEIASEVFRTLIASLGLVLAIPLTTGTAVLLASVGGESSGGRSSAGADAGARGRRADRRRRRRDELTERLSRY